MFQWSKQVQPVQPLTVEDVETIVFLLTFVGVHRKSLRCHHLRHAIDNARGIDGRRYAAAWSGDLLFWCFTASCLVLTCQTLTRADPQVVVQYSFVFLPLVYPGQSFSVVAISPEQMSAMSLAPKKWNDVETYCKVQLESHDS